MPDFKRIVLRTGASAASLGASALEKAAEAMRDMAETDGRTSSSSEVAVEHRGSASKVEPVVASSETSSKPAAQAPVPRRISNPKAARKVRKREAAARSVKRLEVEGQAKGARPAAARGKAEPTPAELAKSGSGRKAAPLGSTDES